MTKKKDEKRTLTNHKKICYHFYMIGGLEMINIDDLRKAEYLDFPLEKDFNDKNKYNLYCYNNITEEYVEEQRSKKRPK